MSGKKRVSIISTAVSLLLALVLVLISHGNISKAEKQNEIMAHNFTELMRIVDEIVGAHNEGGMPKALAFVRDNKDRAAEAVKNLRRVCDYFEKVKVPGNLKDELEKVRAGIPDMRRFLDKYENMFHGVMLESEFLGYVREMSESVSFLEGDGNFILAEQAFMRKLKKLRGRKGGLIWL